MKGAKGENKLFNLELGCSIRIKRSDGRIHRALISAIDHIAYTIKVEWMENGETKGKEVDIDAVLSLNPFAVLKRPADRAVKRRSSIAIVPHSEKSKRQVAVPSSTVHTRSRSARSRLTEDAGSINENYSSLMVQGRSVHSSKSSADTTSQSSVLRKVSRLERNRIERRQRQAESKAHIEELMKLNQSNPHWKLQEMINDHCKKINMRPLSSNDRIDDHTITVCVRKRPMNAIESTRKEIDIITVSKKNQLIVHEPKNKVDLTRYLDNHVFNFDYVFSETCPNALVYKYSAQPLVKTVFEGGFATCFAYGQTGSGKTYTMSGNLSNGDAGVGSEDGIYAMVAQDVFALVDSPQYRNQRLVVSASFFEIYTKKALDLLNNKATLKILEDGKQRIQIVGLTEKVVGSVSEVLKLIEQGNQVRSLGQTSANSNSSRSHAVFQIYLRCLTNMTIVHGKFSLIDLAGNERGADTSSADKQTRMEGAEINKSLLALKECIRALGRKGAHLPFRVSKLTQVLRDSFVGTKSRTCMIAMISPNMGSCEHTLNTLRYADRVKELGGTETHMNALERSLSDSTLKCPLNCIEERLELSDNSVATLHSPRDLESRVAEKKVIDNHVAMSEKLQKAVKDSQCLLELVHEDRFDSKSYCQNWASIVDDCLTSLLVAKELIMSYQDHMNKGHVKY